MNNVTLLHLHKSRIPYNLQSCSGNSLLGPQLTQDLDCEPWPAHLQSTTKEKFVSIFCEGI